MSAMRTTSRAALLAAAALSLAACRDAPARIDLDPPSLRFGVRGQTARVHATPVARNGKVVPDNACAWSSTNEAVARASGPHNDATVTATGPGTASVVCRIGDLEATVAVQVRVVSRVSVAQARADLRMTDEPAPLPLQISAFDDAGAAVQGRAAFSRCANEDVCRGDARGQLWAVGPGATTAVVEVEGARSAEIPVTVVDARTAAGRPQAVRGNPMEAIEREVRKREAEERKAAERAAQQQ
jgi:hypothetical protein